MNFRGSITKYDEQGKALPKGKNVLSQYKKKNPDSLIFDSKSEYNTWIMLKTLEGKGSITNLQRQITFPLLPKMNWFNNVKSKNEVIRPLTYIADFVFTEDGKTVVMDCKGWKYKEDKNGKGKWLVYKDDVYIIKKKLFLHLNPNLIFREN